MPLNDLLITITVSREDGQGKPARSFAVGYRIPANGAAGLALADPGKLKIGTAAEGLGDFLDRNGTDL
jgi:hypothetical protein